MGLRFPDDIGAWQRWQARQHLLRRVRHAFDRGTPPAPLLTSGSDRPTIVVAVESLSPSNVAALLAPLRHLPPEGVAVLSHTDVTARLPEHGWSTTTFTGVPSSVRAVLAASQTGLTADLRGPAVDLLIPQHGLLTPLAPPLPDGATLLAWSQDDADYWWSGRTGGSRVVGSQLFWEARIGHPIDATTRPTYLGQLHGAELPRRDLARAAGTFCAQHGATYRPHPSETDRLSRWQHARWQRRGIAIARAGVPLPELDTPVVSVFSTGVLEAAARGIPAWVDFPDPPAWLVEFWDRYGMRPYGGEPTPAPALPATEPARAVAEILRSYL